MSLTIAGKAIGPIGFGTIGLMRQDQTTSMETMKAALEAGASFWDVGTNYGTPEHNSLHLLNAYFTKYPEDVKRVFISVKGAFDVSTFRATADAASVRQSIETSLAILDSKCQIDLFQAARFDSKIPVEETIGAIAEFVRAGKVGSIGISECSASTVRRAAAVHPIAACEVELSLFATDILQNGVADACKECGIPIVAYSPLSRGFLTGQIRKYEDLAENDFRRNFPRFSPENFENNMKLVDEVEQIARAKGCTMPQVAIAWVAAQSSRLGVPVVPIPGAAAVKRVQENMTRVDLTEAEVQEIGEVLKRCEVKGTRVPAKFAYMLEV
nr:pyridoxal reductase [Quercus suber]